MPDVYQLLGHRLKPRRFEYMNWRRQKPGIRRDRSKPSTGSRGVVHRAQLAIFLQAGCYVEWSDDCQGISLREHYHHNLSPRQYPSVFHCTAISMLW